MSYPMFGLFAINQLNDQDFTISFQIPDNCSYQLSPSSSGNYVISIKLNPGQTEPSSNFVSYEEPTSSSGKALNIIFEQYEKSGVIIRRPKIGVES